MDQLKQAEDQPLLTWVPETPTCLAAFEYAQSQLPLTILHHSLRVFIYADWLAKREARIWGHDERLRDIVFIACICHDLGATHHHDGEQRFEVEGADAAKRFALSQNIREEDAHDVWTAVAVHTSPHIAERIHPLSRLVRLGVLIDFRKATRDDLEASAYVKEIEKSIPRLEIEKVLADAVVEQALRNNQKAPAASWPNNLLKSHLENPDWRGVNKGF
jgi:HD superfamily phosphodiesterase